MLRRLRPRLTYANTMATIAVFIALGATGAADPIADGAASLGGRVGDALDLGKSAKKTAKRAGKKASRALRTAKKADTRAKKALANDAGLLDKDAKAVDAEALDGLDFVAFLRWGSTIPHGTRLTGAFGGTTRNEGGANSAFWDQVITFPFPAPADLTDAKVNFAPSALAKDDDPSCTGTVQTPTAPAGKVCLYPGEAAIGTHDASGAGKYVRGAPRRGFLVEAYGSPKAGIVGSWAYTAP
jgi:hypothetical protein